MLKRLLAVDGVSAVCRFRDDGGLVEGYGMLDDDEMTRLARFAHEYKRLVQANADQWSMFTRVSGWTPPTGWVVRSRGRSVVSVANLVCIVENRDGSMNEVLSELTELAHR